MQEERVLHEAKLAKMEAEMKMVFQQKVQEKEAKLKQSEEELYARHREMKESLEKQRLDLVRGRQTSDARERDGKIQSSFCHATTRDTDRFSSRKQGKVSFVLERSDGFVTSSARKVRCHPCNPFHGVSIAICATLSSSSILLHSPLYFIYSVPALVLLAPVTLVCTDIHGIFRHSFV